MKGINFIFFNYSCNHQRFFVVLSSKSIQTNFAFCRILKIYIMEEILVTLVIFGSIFGVFYLHYSTRNRERMALIEKGADASIFFTKKKERSNSPIWKIFVLNIALLLMGIGVGIVTGAYLGENTTMDFNVMMPGSIFFFAGTGLVTGYFITSKFDKNR